MNEQQALIDFFLRQTQQCSNGQHIETALSHIFVFTEDVYKLKKSVDVGYVDLRSLEKRRQCCENEIVLNSRYAPQIYLSALSVVRDGSGFRLKSVNSPAAIDYVVHMQRFPEDALLSQRLQQGRVTSTQVRQLARMLSKFHSNALYVGPLWNYSAFVTGMQPTLEALNKSLTGMMLERAKFIQLRLLRSLESKAGLIDARDACRVRGHGDLHAGNICTLDGDVLVPFDGIDFSEELICIDRLFEIAFLVMDFAKYGRSDLGFAFLNEYLEQVGDYEGLKLMPLFCCYRALIRCLICMREGKEMAAERYLRVANSCLESTKGRVVAVGGLSGTGKSTLGRMLSEHCGGIQIRSDVIRKSIIGLDMRKCAGLAYSQQANADTYDRLTRLVFSALEAGYNVFVDATFRSSDQRRLLEQLVISKGFQFTGLWCEVPTAIAIDRIAKRQDDVSDADIKVRLQQEDENSGAITWNKVDASGGPEAVLEVALQYLD